MEIFEPARHNLYSEPALKRSSTLMMGVKRRDRKKKSVPTAEQLEAEEEETRIRKAEEAAVAEQKAREAEMDRMAENMTEEELTERAANEVVSFSNLDDFLRAFADNPYMDSASPAGCEKIFALPSLDVFDRLRVGTFGNPPTYDDLLKALIDISKDELEIFMQVNRDQYDFRFFFRLMSMKLRAENTKNSEEEEIYTRALVRGMKECWKFDLPLKNQVGTAEARLGGLLARVMQSETPTAQEVIDAAGDGPVAIFAFWFTLQAAIAAWDEKLSIARRADDARARGMAKQRLQELGQLQGAIEASPLLLERGGIDPLNRLLAGPNLAYQCGVENDPRTVRALRAGQKGQFTVRMRERYPGWEKNMTEEEDFEFSMAAIKEKLAPKPGDNEGAHQRLEAVAPDSQERLLLIRRLGCMAMQANRHRFKQFNPLLRRVSALYDVLAYGEARFLDPVDTMEEEGFDEFPVDELTGESLSEDGLLSFFLDGVKKLDQDEQQGFWKLYKT